jgi:hypothetical protein
VFIKPQTKGAPTAESIDTPIGTTFAAAAVETSAPLKPDVIKKLGRLTTSFS